MNRDRVKGTLKAAVGRVREQTGKLTCVEAVKALAGDVKSN